MKRIEESEEFKKESKELNYRPENILDLAKKQGFDVVGTLSLSEHEIYDKRKNIDSIDIVISDNASEYRPARINVGEFNYLIKMMDNSQTAICLDEKWQDYLLEIYGNEYALRLYEHLTEKISMDEQNVKSLKTSWANQISKLEETISRLEKEKLSLEHIIEGFECACSHDSERLGMVKEYITNNKSKNKDFGTEF